MTPLQRLLPWLVGVLVLAYLGSLLPRAATAPSAPNWDLIGRIPVSADGRVKPLDTFARNNLMALSGRQTFDRDGVSGPAIQWLLELITDPPRAATRPVFRIDHPDLVAMLGLEETKRTRFAFNELVGRFAELQRQAQMASEVPPKRRDPFQRQVLDLGNRLSIYSAIQHHETPYVVAPLAPGEEWQPLTALFATPAAMNHPSARAIASIFSHAAEGKAPALNEEARSYLQLLDARLPSGTSGARYELEFNRLEPFYVASILYVLAFILGSTRFLMGALSRPGWARSLGVATLTVLTLAFLVHTLGLGSRIYLQGRPPVTNLYSSAVFIGWAAIPIALAAEAFYRLGIGSAVAALVGFATLVVAHNLSSGGDTMEMMQAVLDSNFWLATHVVVVTIGYSATFLAGFLAAAYILLGVATTWLRGEPAKALPKMTYGIICFASITSFVGTVLGGIWADQSWGRFWGWDPKENGAALIVLMNLLILHARWGGMIRERGVAVLAVAGNIVTAWSWFGTNMLGVGLHSYGFMDSAVFWILAFAASQLVIMAVGLVPAHRWRSLRNPEPTVPRHAPPPRTNPVAAG